MWDILHNGMCVNAKSSAKNRAGIVLGRLVLACPWLLPLSSPLRHLSGVCGLRICVHSVRTCCGQTHFRIHSQPSALSSNEGKNSTLAWHSKFTHNMDGRRYLAFAQKTWLCLGCSPSLFFPHDIPRFYLSPPRSPRRL